LGLNMWGKRPTASYKGKGQTLRSSKRKTYQAFRWEKLKVWGSNQQRMGQRQFKVKTNVERKLVKNIIHEKKPGDLEHGRKWGKKSILRGGDEKNNE